MLCIIFKIDKLHFDDCLLFHENNLIKFMFRKIMKHNNHKCWKGTRRKSERISRIGFDDN